MNKLTTFISALVLIIMVIVASPLKASGENDGESPADQAEEHYEVLTPIVEGATAALDGMYALDERLADGTVTLESARSKTIEQKEVFLSRRAELDHIDVPEDFVEVFKMLLNWMNQAEKTFDLMLLTIEKETADAEEFDKALDDFYSAWDLEIQMYEEMTEAYVQQMAEFNFELY